MARYTSSKANPSGRAQRDQGGGRFGEGGGLPLLLSCREAELWMVPQRGKTQIKPKAPPVLA